MRGAAVVLVTLALAGCGSGGGEGGPGSNTTAGVAPSQRELDKQIAYDTGGKICIQYTLKEAAELYGVEEDPRALAEAVAKDEPDRELRDLMRRGCLDAFER